MAVGRAGAHDRPQVNQNMDVVFDMSKAHFLIKRQKRQSYERARHYKKILFFLPKTNLHYFSLVYAG